MPYALVLIALATFIVLFLFTGSVILPLKALVLNVLSLTAAFGALVWIFQEGHLGEIRHIRALWHRNNAVPRIEKDSNGKLAYLSDL